MPVEYSLAICTGRVIVMERRPDAPLIIHTFDCPEHAIDFYERHRSEPLPEAKRARILQEVKPQWQ